MIYFEYEWDYPTTEEQTLIPDVLYDICSSYGTSNTSTGTIDSLTADELDTCIQAKGECLYIGLDEYYATANETTSTKYTSFAWSWFAQSSSYTYYNYYGYTSVEWLMSGW